MKALIVAFIGSLVSAGRNRDPLAWENGGLKPESNETNGFTQGWFTNSLDHFNHSETATYKQRYWTNVNYFDSRDGPVFLYICGEWTC